MDIFKWREQLSGIKYHEWQRLRELIDREMDIKISECERRLALGLPDATTEDLQRLG